MAGGSALRTAFDGSPALGIGPLAVRPDWQRRGVGSALMYAVPGAADALDEPLVGRCCQPRCAPSLGIPAQWDKVG